MIIFHIFIMYIIFKIFPKNEINYSWKLTCICFIRVFMLIYLIFCIDLAQTAVSFVIYTEMKWYKKTHIITHYKDIYSENPQSRHGITRDWFVPMLPLRKSDRLYPIKAVEDFYSFEDFFFKVEFDYQKKKLNYIF